MTDKYAVLGNPVNHSISPQIHAEFARQTGQNISYEKLEVPLEGFAEFIAELHKKSYQGMNVTLPFKEQAFQLSESLSTAAEHAGAVNTLIRTATGWRGDNTDGVGLVRDLTKNLSITLKQKNILILGAGGAVRGILELVLREDPKQIHIANRTAEKAVALAEKFKHLGNVVGTGLDGPFEEQYDLIINGTAASIKGKVPAIPDGLLKTGGATYDMFYAKEPTAFVEWAKQQGAEIAADGLGMLIEQAAESFYLWREIKPVTKYLLNDISKLKAVPLI